MLIKLSALIAVLYMPCSTYAQQMAMPDYHDVVLKNDILPGIVEPTIDSPVQSPQPTFVLEASKDDLEGVASVGLQFGDFGILGKLASPVEKGKSEVTSANLEGSAKDASLSISAQYLSWNPTADPLRVKSIAEEFNKLSGQKANKWTLADAKQQIEKKTKDAQNSTGAEALRYQREAEQMQDLLKKMESEIDWGTVCIISVNGKIANSEISYFDNGLAKDAQKISSSIGGSVGALFDGVGYIGINYAYGHAFKGGDLKNYVMPLDNGIGEEARELSSVIPSFKDEHRFQLEYRSYLTESIGTSIRLSYEANEKVWGFDWPIYFLSAKDKGVSGGVRVGYTTKDKKLLLGVFVGSVLSLLP